MIIQNSKGAFGARLAIIKDHNENLYTISTAKEGLLKGLSTMIMEGKYPAIRPCVKIIYSKSLRKNDRQGLHDVITKEIDIILNEGDLNLHDAVNFICGDLQNRGVISELINIA